MSYSTFNLVPYLGRSYSRPANKEVLSPENQSLKLNCPPCESSVPLVPKDSCREVNGLEMRHVRVKTIDGYCKNGYFTFFR